MAANLKRAVSEELNDQLSFETLLLEISSRFATIPAQDVRREIGEALRLICKHLQVDESAIYLRDPDGPETFVRACVVRGSRHSPANGKRLMPWCSQKLMANETICLPDIETAPPEAAVDRETWRSYGLHSKLVLPLRAGELGPIGFWGIGETSKKREWPEPLQRHLRLIADVFASALARDESDRQLREREERLKLVTSTAGSGFWTIDANTRNLWVTPNLPTLFGLTAQDPISLPRFLDAIHPEDRERVKDVLESMLKGNEETVEYRILLPDGSIRWVVSRGGLYESSAGKAPCLVGVTLDITEHRMMMEGTLGALSARLLEAQELERQRIARELHDSVNQRVAMIAMGIGQLRAADHVAPAERRNRIDRLLKETQAVGSEIRALSHELHSESLEYLGLVSAISGFCGELRERHGAEIALKHNDMPESLPAAIALALFRVAQEALHNAMKHSGVRRFEVRLHATATRIELKVRDSGVGFDVDKAMKGLGLGLISMRERVTALRGVLTIKSMPGEGTEIRVRVPIG